MVAPKVKQGVVTKASEFAISPVKQSDRLADTIYDRLRDLVLLGSIPSGSKLSVPALAQTLQVSRTTVREAVLRLTKDGLANEVPRRGVVVASVTLAELAVIYQVRESLEGLATKLAVLRGHKILTEALAPILERHALSIKNRDIRKTSSADRQFHLKIRTAANNPYLIQLLDGVQTKVLLAMRTTSVTAGVEKAYADHVRIFEAICANDAELAEKHARAHISRLRQVLLTNIDQNQPHKE